jgi:hypothetical protein
VVVVQLDLDHRTVGTEEVEEIEDPLDILKVVVVVIGGHLVIHKVGNHVKILGGAMSIPEEEEAAVATVETVVVPAMEVVDTEDPDTAVDHPDVTNVASMVTCAPTNVLNDNSLKRKFNKLPGLILMPMITFLWRRVGRMFLIRLMSLRLT